MKKPKLIKVIIDRKRWYRGQGEYGDSLLRLENGQQCCLGFAARVLGCRAKDIVGNGMPEETIKELRGLTEVDYAGDIVNTDFSVKAAGINDDSKIDEKTRERQLKTLARNNGFIFQFVN